MKKLSLEQMLNEIHNLNQNANGPDKYVISAIGLLIQSNEKVFNAGEKFHKSTNKTEKVMLYVAIAQVILAVAQIIMAALLKG